MNSPARRASARKPIKDALQAGALVAGVFLSLLGVLRATIRLHLLPRSELAVLLPVAILVVLVPLGVGIKLGFRDETPPSLRAYRHALPWSRSPTEELLGAVLGGAVWSVLGMGLTTLLDRFVPVVAIGEITTALLGPAIAAVALFLIHGRGWTSGRAFAVVLLTDLLLAAPQIALGPRGPLGATEGLSILAREYFEAAEHFGKHPGLSQQALVLALQACEADQARGCVLASFALSSKEAAHDQAQTRGEADLLLRRACDLTATDLALCARFVGEPFSSTGPSPCTVEARCAAGHGVDCHGGLLACKQAMVSGQLTPACGRREAGGWREVWCGLPLSSP